MSVRITDVREVTKPISSPIRNAYIDFSKMTSSLVAVVTNAERNGQRVIGYGFECSFQRLGWKRSTPAQVADSTLRGADGQSNVSHGICSDWI